MQALVWTQIGFILLLLLGAEALLWFFPSAYQIKAAVHGVSSILAIVTATYLFRLARPVFVTVKNLLDNRYLVDRVRGMLPGSPRLVHAGFNYRFHL